MRHVTALAVVLLVLPLAGCLKSKEVFTLDKDGSGTVTSSYVVSMGKARELFSAAAMLMGQGSPEEIAKIPDEDLANFEHPAWYRAAGKTVEGYEVLEASQKLTGTVDAGDRVRTTNISARFASLAAASKANAFATSTVTLSEVEKSEKAPKGGWKLTLKDAMAGMDPSMTGGMDPTQMLPMFEGQLKGGLSLSRTVTVPGTILETNGTKAEDGRTVSWTITYDKILEGKDLTMTVVFEAAEGSTLKPFTFAPDVMALTQRMMSKPPAAKKDPAKGADAKGGAEQPTKKADGEKKADGGK